MYELIKRDGRAKRGRFHTVHGVIETPVFMNVGTIAAIKGAVSTADLEEIGTQVELSNTYHLHEMCIRDRYYKDDISEKDFCGNESIFKFYFTDVLPIIKLITCKIDN